MKMFNREQLYKEIWDSSAHQLAIKYGLNYQKLLNQCRKFNIPLPSGKYFYNRKHGLDTKDLIIPLPHSDIEDIEVELQKSKEKKNIVKDSKTVAKNQDIGEVSEIDSKNNKQTNGIIFEKEVLYISLDFLDDDKKNRIVEVLTKLGIKENKRLHKKVASFKKQVSLWETKVRKSQRDYYDSRYERNDMEQPKFIKEVSKENYDRLYKLLDIIFEIFDQIGETINDDLCIQIGEDKVSFEIIESTDKVKHELTKKEAKEILEYEDIKNQGGYAFKPKIRKYDYVYNGKFRIKMSTGKYIKDNKEAKLEDMMPEVIIMFYEAYAEMKRKREEHEEWVRQRDEERKEKEEYQERVSNEKKKTLQFLNMLDDYRLSMEIRNFIKVIDSNDKINNQEFISWMLAKADWFDPTVSKEDELLGKREHHINLEDKMNFLKNKTSKYWNEW